MSTIPMLLHYSLKGLKKHKGEEGRDLQVNTKWGRGYASNN
jgi:hypothetical protein